MECLLPSSLSLQSIPYGNLLHCTCLVNRTCLDLEKKVKQYWLHRSNGALGKSSHVEHTVSESIGISRVSYVAYLWGTDDSTSVDQDL